jgi:hypothetical protein
LLDRNLAMLEKTVEAYLKKRVESKGGITWKISFVGRRGCPDRLVILNREVWLIELKRPGGGRLSALQSKTIGMMREMGMKVVVLSSKEEVDTWLG